MHRSFEYDILPHEDISHQSVQRHGSALGICSCTLRYYTTLLSSSLGRLSEIALLFLLLISPNTTTFWNYRRRAVLSNRITADRELWLTRLILRTHPRSNETLFHRQWIVRNFYPEIGSLLDTEFELCDQLADLYRMQYGVWDYRRFLLRSTVGLQTAIVEAKRVEAWLRSHPSDASGWSYLADVLEMLLRNTSFPRGEMKQMLLTHVHQVTTMLEIYPERECVWIFRRSVLSLLCELCSCDRISMALSHIEPQLPKASEVLRLYAKERPTITSLSDFLYWCYTHKLSSHPELTTWRELLSLRHLLWLCQSLGTNQNTTSMAITHTSV
ncbi:unnamed protein product [Dicrocoelium dendriticum]|nr:unnamed protein product [Dicrocoelium dendriticum]